MNEFTSYIRFIVGWVTRLQDNNGGKLRFRCEPDHEMAEELGDLLLQVVFHSQLAQERGAFDFDQVCQHIVDKLIRRHPHVFAQSRVRSVEGVWAQWDQIKHAEKTGTRHERPSVLDGIPAICRRFCVRKKW